MTTLNKDVYITAKSRQDLIDLKESGLFNNILISNNQNITVEKWDNKQWNTINYVEYGKADITNYRITGFGAYLAFYYYCGKKEVDYIKTLLPPLEEWETAVQLHYFNYEYSQKVIHNKVYVYDANSAFTYGAMKLDKEFAKLQEYMQFLYDKKRFAETVDEKAYYKSMQVMLVGFFARVRDLTGVRSEIIANSNVNIYNAMQEVANNKGIVYLSNTDSIFTDERGAEVMESKVGNEVGKFKLEHVGEKLYFNGSNSYQLDNKVVYSGVGYFEKQDVDLSSTDTVKAEGNLAERKIISKVTFDEEKRELYTITPSEVIVTTYNQLGEKVSAKKYIERGILDVQLSQKDFK